VKKKKNKNKKKKNNKEKKWVCLLWNKGIQVFYWGALPTDNWILIFLIIPSVILSVIFNLNFQFRKFFSETANNYWRFFNQSVIPSVIFKWKF
jgi:hypothetical protein